jgi:phosphate transport system permease protein
MSNTRELVEKNLAKRYRAEKRFRFAGMCAIGFGLLWLVVLFTHIISEGVGAFSHTVVQLEVEFSPETLGVDDATNDQQLALGNFNGIVRQALNERFPDASSRKELRELYSIMSSGAGYELRRKLRANPQLLGETRRLWLLVDDDIDIYVKSRGDASAFTGRVSDITIDRINSLLESGDMKRRFNTNFFTNGDSSEPELAGVLGAMLGSFFTLVVTLVLSFPVGVAAAIYLEEYAPRNKWTDFIEVNINNLAAVPSIIFGLLGLAIFLNFFGMPRSIPLVGGLVLTLMTLPTIIISSRAAIKAVPPSIREAALGIGASKMQMILHHVLPLALPGMLTGAIIGMAQALGETAPLLMIGMVAFIADIPGGITDPATVLPVQIFLWSESPERAFVQLTSAAIMILLVFLITMNTLAIWLRRHLERRW